MSVRDAKDHQERGVHKCRGENNLWPKVRLACVGSRAKRARPIIGRRCSIGDRTEIHCGDSVTIGDDVIISWDRNILDRDYHSVDGGPEVDRREPNEVRVRV